MANASGWMWSSTTNADRAIIDGTAKYVQRHCRFPQWVRARLASLGTLRTGDTLDGVRIVVDETIPFQHYLFGVNGGADVGQDTRHNATLHGATPLGFDEEEHA